MSGQNLIIYKLNSFYQILEELDLDFSFQIIFIDSEKLLNDQIRSKSNYIIITDQKNLNLDNQIILDNLPISISKFFEIINIKFLKLQFNNQSQIKISKYIIDLNSREMQFNYKWLKLTEKETYTIIYLSKKNRPVSVDELQKNVWSYQSDIETHTVETHIYRLRKKIFKIFDDNEFIISKKNGYQIK